jgi:glutamine amidotransferase
MIALVDYGNEKIESIAGALTSLNVNFKITKSESEIISSEKVIFPGYGEASDAIKKLHLTNLYSVLRICKKPMLGVCLGMQLMADISTEGGKIPCLGIFPVVAEKFLDEQMKVPFSCWSEVEILEDSKLFTGLNKKENFYFGNSYYLPVNEFTTSVSENVVKFSATVEKENYYAVQFYPEKSGVAGQKVLQNFIELC